MVGSGALKVTEFQASVPPGKRSESKKGKWKRPGEVLLWDESVSWNRECACSSSGRLIGQAGWESPDIFLCALRSYRTRSGGYKLLDPNPAAVTHHIYY